MCLTSHPGSFFHTLPRCTRTTFVASNITRATRQHRHDIRSSQTKAHCQEGMDASHHEEASPVPPSCCFLSLCSHSFFWEEERTHSVSLGLAVTFRVSRTWCRTLPRGLSALGIVILFVLRFCVPEAYETRAETQRSESVSVSIETPDVGGPGTVRLYTCVYVSLQRPYLDFVFMTCFSQSLAK